MTISHQLLAALQKAIDGHPGFLCLDREPSPFGLGGTFIKPKPEDWVLLPGCPRHIWPEGKFRYVETVIAIGQRRNKQAITVLVADSIERSDLAALQRAYVDSL